MPKADHYAPSLKIKGRQSMRPSPFAEQEYTNAQCMEPEQQVKKDSERSKVMRAAQHSSQYNAKGDRSQYIAAVAGASGNSADSVKGAKGVIADSAVLPIEVGLVNAKPRGVPVSGRLWKAVEVKRSSMKAASLERTSWSKRQDDKDEAKRIREKANRIKEDMRLEAVEEIRRIKQRRAAKAANQEKSVVVQKITDTKKLKAMTKNQLRLIEKR
jgi:hypothetical protein